jgi:Ni/Co efflux regulator RcnB
MRLPQLYWIARYVMARYASAGFDPPRRGAQWIRYGPDLLMIDLAAGDVVEAVYGVFDSSGSSASRAGAAEF